MSIARIGGEIVLVVAAVVRSVGGLLSLVRWFQVPHQSAWWAAAATCRCTTSWRALTVVTTTFRIEQARVATAEILYDGAYVGPQALPFDGRDVQVFRRFRLEMLSGLLDLLLGGDRRMLMLEAEMLTGRRRWHLAREVGELGRHVLVL